MTKKVELIGGMWRRCDWNGWVFDISTDVIKTIVLGHGQIRKTLKERTIWNCMQKSKLVHKESFNELKINSI